ncbi:sugar phosphate isomerase/epimerase [Roseomonas sp. AR75]|uniref:sugar phosphate isomerase/epimerase family protein n=1 Tax=Roseomonas sp. AR75 TaxID=2562311 RepID=UPI001485ACC0|nr:sugar phosphate isomerase/epimerase family protein [Roseomonas sp. AR75]
MTGADRARLRRLAISLYATPDDLPVEDFCAMLAERGIGGVGLTARAVEAHAPAALRAMLDRHGLVATSLNSAGYVLHADATEARKQADLDARLIAAAAELGAPVNLIPGGLLHGAAAAGLPTLAEARTRTAERLDGLAAQARAAGVVLSLEPMHPAAIATRSCVNTLDAARALIAGREGIGLTLDFYHSWWDPGLHEAIAQDVARMHAVQICGLELPTDGSAPRRAELGAGPPDLRSFVTALEAAGYRGLLEYEVFFGAMGAPETGALLDRAVRDFLALPVEA